MNKIDDTISRQAAIDALRTCYDTETITYDNGDEYIHYGDAVGEVEQLPSVTPKQRTGKWNKLDMDTLNCNKCGATFVINQGSEKMHFCPNCGSRNEVTE